jgi:hypothetical protein
MAHAKFHKKTRNNLRRRTKQKLQQQGWRANLFFVSLAQLVFLFGEKLKTLKWIGASYCLTVVDVSNNFCILNFKLRGITRVVILL